MLAGHLTMLFCVCPRIHLMDEVRVKAVAECYAGNRGAGLGTILNDLGFEGLGLGAALWLREIPA